MPISRPTLSPERERQLRSILRDNYNSHDYSKASAAQKPAPQDDYFGSVQDLPDYPKRDDSSPRFSLSRLFVGASLSVAIVSCLVGFSFLPTLAAKRQEATQSPQASPVVKSIAHVENSAVETILEPPTPIPSPSLDYVATQLSLVNAIGTKQAETNLQNAALKQMELDIAQAAADAEKYKAAQREYDAKRVDGEKLLYQAKAQAEKNLADRIREENKRQDAAVKIAELQAQAQRDAGIQAVALVVLSVIGLFCYIVLRAMKMPAAPVDDEIADDETPAEPARVHVVEENTTYPIPFPPGDFGAFLEWAHHARTGGSLAYNKVVGAGLPYNSNAAYAPVSEWAHKYKLVERDGQGRVVLSRRGEDYCDEQLAAANYGAPPPPPADLPQNEPPADHAHDINSHDDGGGVSAGEESAKK